MERNITKKPNLLLSIAQCKCSRCRRGDMFPYSAFNIAKFTQTNERCPVCKFKFEIEPGFFVGAMYIGYAISVALFTTVAVGINILSNIFGFETSVRIYVISIIVATILMIPFNFRYSRVLMLYWFGGESAKYDEKAVLEAQN